MLQEAIQKVIEEYFLATRTMDLEAWLATFAEDAVSHEPVGSSPLQGHEDMRQFFQNIVGVFKKVGVTEDSVFLSGNGAAVKWTGFGVGKNGHEITFEGINVFEVNEAGKIKTLWSYWNPSAVMGERK